jgi:hypothetical protein
MKTKALLLVLVLFMCTTSAFSQEYKYFREGNLTYVQDYHGFISSLASTKMQVQSYMSQEIQIPPKSVQDSIIKTVITKVRAKELKNYRIWIYFHFDGVKGQLAYISAYNKKDGLKLKLEELDRLEKAFKKLKYNFTINGRNRKIIPTSVVYANLYRFDKLYED